MKRLIIALFLLLPISSASAQIAIGGKRLTCSRSHIPQAQKWIEPQSSRSDKFKHCAVSCYLRLRCSSREVLLVGALKEFYDAMGYGNPEFADFLADYRGMRLAQDGRARQDNDCVRLCSQQYP